MTTREPQVRAEPTRHANPAGNKRLTAMTGAVLLVLFVAECLTLLNMGRLLTLHVFLWGWRSPPITSLSLIHI